MSAAPTSLAWFARHEAGLAWREWLALTTAGRPTRRLVLLAVLLGVAIVAHLIAGALLGPWIEDGIAADAETLFNLTISGVLLVSVMLSQALELVTRAYYARADLDLILSSPASARRVFAVRTGAVALSSMVLACLLASPVVNILILGDGPRWFAAYGVLAALGAFAAAIAVCVTLVLFRTVGPRRTRTIAQVLAAIAGAGFVIIIQGAAILSLGSFSRIEFLASDAVQAMTPAADSPLYIPARAAFADPALLAVMLGLAGLALVGTIAFASRDFAGLALAASGAAARDAGRRSAIRPLRARSPAAALRAKEWTLLRRDPWLISQTLMQLLYLAPPALLLWLNFGAAGGAFIVVVPVIVMASGQLAGGLAWLAVSGEDAPDLIATAPVPAGAVLRAKIEAVLGAVAILAGPLLILLALAAPTMAVIAALFAALATASATAIQLWFRLPQRRSLFNRRQVASRTATISEAFVAILWAATAALIAAGGIVALMAIGPAMLALGVLGLAFWLSPRKR